jgi:UDP-N-acetylglucosamine acyltransferase
VKRAYKLVYRSGLNVTQAVAQGRTMTWQPEAARFLDFVGTRSKRGLCAARGADAAVIADAED